MIAIRVSDADSGAAQGGVVVQDGCTVSDYFRKYKTNVSLSNYRVMVNNQKADADTTLYENSLLVISPSKLAGAVGKRYCRLS